jgi:hypothetical protein
MLKLIFLLLNILYYINCGCADTTPRLNTDCIKESTQLTYCCYAYNGVSKVCYEQNRIAWKEADSTSVNFNGLSFTLDCGVGSETKSLTGPKENEKINEVIKLNPSGVPNVGPACGVANPATFQDCASSSMFGNSCCLYEYNGGRYCHSLGRSWRGTQTYQSVTVTCSEKWLSISLLSLILLFFI